MKLLIQWLLLLSFIIYGNQAIAGIVMIMHKESPIVEVEEETIKDLYLGSKKYVQDIRILPLDQNNGEISRQKFYQTVIKKPKSQLISHWARLIFTGKGQAPIALFSDESILMFVSSNPNSIGYIDERFLTGEVKVVLKLDD